jgi:hypothetical protein
MSSYARLFFRAYGSKRRPNHFFTAEVGARNHMGVKFIQEIYYVFKNFKSFENYELLVFLPNLVL